MKRSLRIVPAAVAAVFLASCGGGNTQSSGMPQAPPRTNAFSVVENGVAIGGTHIMPSRQNTAVRAIAQATTSSNLIYGDGLVQLNAKVYLVFWQFYRNDPYGEQPRITTFVRGLNRSQWTSELTQYYDRSGHISNDIVYGGSWNDNANAIPLHATQAQVAAEAARAAAHFGDYSANAMYLIALEKGKDPEGFGTQWCAFHSDTPASGHTIAYEDFPYQTDAGASCGENAVNSGTAGRLDGVTIVGGHEMVEAVTDPQPYSGWADPRANEIADKCAWTYMKNTSFSTGSFPTQSLWSNSGSHCVQ